MAEEVIDAPPAEQTREFGTPLDEIFKKSMPTDDELSEKETVKDAPKEEPVKEQPKKEAKVEPKKEEKKEASSITDLLEAPVEEKKEEVSIEGLEKEKVPDEIKGKTAREHFERLSTAKYEVEKKLKTTEKQLNEEKTKASKGSETVTQELEAARNTVKDLSERLGRAGLEHHPWFEQNFIIPKRNAFNAANIALKEAGVEPTELVDALRLSGKARADKLDEMYAAIPSATLKGKVERAVDVIENIDYQQAHVLQNRDKYEAELQKNDAHKQAKFFEDFEKSTKDNLNEAKKFLLEKHGFFVFKKIDNPSTDEQKQWNDTVDKMDVEAEYLTLKTTDPKEMAVAARLATATVPVFALLKKEIESRKYWQKKAESYMGSEPKLGSGERKSKKTTDDEEDEDMDIATAISRRIHGNKD